MGDMVWCRKHDQCGDEDGRCRACHKNALLRTTAEDAVLRAAVAFVTAPAEPMLARAEARRQLEDSVRALPPDHPARVGR